MKKTILLLAILLQCSCNLLFGQWVQISSVPTAQLNAVKFLNVNTGIVVGSGGIWRSTNSGVNWIHVLTGPNLNSLSFIDIYTGLAVGDSGRIFKTSDGGLVWNQQGSVTANNLYAVQFFSQSSAFAVGQNGIYLSSFSAGSDWNVDYAFNQDLYAVFMIADEEGFVAGASNSEFFETTGNGGANWAQVIEQTGGPRLNSAAPVKGLYSYVLVGNNGRVRRTTDSGWHWTLPPANTIYNLYDVTFVDTNSGWLCGQYGLIENSTNGGVSWSIQETPGYSDLHGISFINNTTGWAAGSNGVVLRTGIPVSVQQSNTEIPVQYKLYQNYPNPFNNVTIIDYDVQKLSKIKITVYNILGKKLLDLVNEVKEAGEYRFVYDCKGLSSGIYFYLLYADSKIYDKKKLIFIK